MNLDAGWAGLVASQGEDLRRVRERASTLGIVLLKVRAALRDTEHGGLVDELLAAHGLQPTREAVYVMESD